MKKITREQTKIHNKTLVLNTLYQQSECSRADLARITKLTRSTVSEIISDLLEEGLVEEIGFGQSAGGKPPVLLHIVEESRHIIGIDLASGEFRGAVVNLRGKIKTRFNLETHDRSGYDALELVYELIDKLIELSPSSVIGIGIGAPGLMNAENGIVRTAVNLDWRELPLADILFNRYQLPVYIANDSQVSALAEYNFGESQYGEDLLLVKLSRGVGAGIILNQQLFHGDNFGAGEIGHIKVDDNGIQCRCGNQGCLETKISSRAISIKATQIAQENPNSVLHNISQDIHKINIHEVLQAFRENDPDVVSMINSFGAELGKALSYVLSALNIDRVVLSGSVSMFGDGLIKPTMNYLKKSMLKGLVENVEITVSVLGEDIVLLGAVGMVLQNELGIS